MRLDHTHDEGVNISIAAIHRLSTCKSFEEAAKMGRAQKSVDPDIDSKLGSLREEILMDASVNMLQVLENTLAESKPYSDDLWSALSLLLDYARGCCNVESFATNVGWTFLLKHNLGQNWSDFLVKFLKLVFERFSSNEHAFELISTRYSVNVKIRIRVYQEPQNLRNAV